MKALTFTIKLLEPLLSKSLEGDANIGISMNYIAGSLLRGTIINLSNLKNDIAFNERDLFFNESVKFLNAYPLIKIRDDEYKRALPVPISWHKEKDATEQTGIYIKDFSNSAKLEKHKNLSNPFFAFKRNDVILKKLNTRLAVHTTRNVSKGRSDEKEGAIFRYESIVEGTKFGGAILSQNTDLLQKIKDWINTQEVLLGGSRNSGYGKALIICDPDFNDWQEPQVPIAKQILPNSKFTITLLSNAFIRDKNGHFQTELTAESLGLQESDISLCAKQTFKRGELVGGFNRKWGLPLPQMLSIAAGSVFKFKAEANIAESKVKNWLENGIGVRTLDGFGRIAVDLQTLDSYSISKESEIITPTIKLSDKSKTIGIKLAENIVKTRLESELNSQVHKYKIVGSISNSQISRLRMHIREIRRGEKADFSDFFSKLPNTATKQFEETAKVAYEKHSANLKNWIEKVFEKKDIISVKEVTFGDENKAVGNESAFLKEFHLRLIDGVLAKKAKESRND